MGPLPKYKRAEAAATKSSSAMTSGGAKYPRFGKRGAPQAFPSKLYEILEGEDPAIVGWTATGRGFEVRDHARLSSEVLGRFFKQDKFSSFQRQLNLYGFRKITKGSEAGSYQHPHFRRGERTTLLTIRRSTKASPARLPTSPSASEPAPSMYAEGRSSAPSTPSPSLESSSAPGSRMLPWQRGGVGLPSISRDVQPARSSPLHQSHGEWRGGGGCGGGGAAPAADERQGGVEPPADTPIEWDRHRQIKREGSPFSWRKSSGGGGEYISSRVGNGAGGGWANADANTICHPKRDEHQWGIRTNESTKFSRENGYDKSGDLPGRIRWEEAPETKPREKQDLDHQDVEVVGLLHQMAKQVLDSSNGREQSSVKRSERDSVCATAKSSSPHFRMPRPQEARNRDLKESDSTGCSDRLYDMLSRERESGGISRKASFPFSSATNGRNIPVGFNHVRLPAPFPGSPTGDSCRNPHVNSFSPSKVRPAMVPSGDRLSRLRQRPVRSSDELEKTQDVRLLFEAHDSGRGWRDGRSPPQGSSISGPSEMSALAGDSLSTYPHYNGFDRIYGSQREAFTYPRGTTEGSWAYQRGWQFPESSYGPSLGMYAGDHVVNKEMLRHTMIERGDAWAPRAHEAEARTMG